MRGSDSDTLTRSAACGVKHTSFTTARVLPGMHDGTLSKELEVCSLREHHIGGEAPTSAALLDVAGLMLVDEHEQH